MRTSNEVYACIFKFIVIKITELKINIWAWVQKKQYVFEQIHNFWDWVKKNNRCTK